MAVKILPAVLASSAQQLRRQIQLAGEYSSTIHVDIADGSLTSTRTVGPKALANLRSTAVLEAHIMSSRPDRWLTTVLALGVRRVVIHVELGAAVKPYLALFRSQKISVILAINPGTPLRRLDRWITLVQGVQVMGVVPGRLGARWHPQTVARISQLHHRFPRLALSCDGGMTPDTMPAVVQAGAGIVIVGSYLQQHDDPDAAWKKLRAAGRASA